MVPTKIAHSCRVTTLLVLMMSLPVGLAGADAPKGVYNVGTSGAFGKSALPACGRESTEYLAAHPALTIKYLGSVVVGDEEWVFDGEDAMLAGAHRPQNRTDVKIEVWFGRKNKHAYAVLIYSELDASHKKRCSTAKHYTGAFTR